ncbi:MAG: class I SAM-dependent methyltransferase [Thermoproteota archaeon]
MKYDAKEHWENIWTTKKSNEVSWYQEYPKTSINLILPTNPSKDAKIIDVGGGDSNLAETLFDLGFKNITVLDISANALERAKKRLGNKSGIITWIESDILEFENDNRYDIWHDRALLHFLTSEENLKNYVKLVKQHVIQGGYLIISTFSTKGPIKCSGLDTRQYSEESIKELFSNEFEHIKSFEEEHVTPRGMGQIFTWNVFRKTK